MTPREPVLNIETYEAHLEYLIDEIPEVGLSDLGELEELAAELLGTVKALNDLYNLRRVNSGGQ